MTVTARDMAQKQIAVKKGVSKFPQAKGNGDVVKPNTKSSLELVAFNPRARDVSSSSHPQPRPPVSLPKLAPVRPSASGISRDNAKDRGTAFGERKSSSSAWTNGNSKGKSKSTTSGSDRMTFLPGGGAEISWVPATSGAGDDSLFDDGRGMEQKSNKKERGGKVEKFGAGMERGKPPKNADDGRTGRTKRRTNVRSGSRNVFRQL